MNAIYKMVTVSLTRTQKFNFYLGFPGDSCGKESACQCRRGWFSPWVGKISWRRKWQPTPVFFLTWTLSVGSQRAGHDLVTKYTCTDVCE